MISPKKRLQYSSWWQKSCTSCWSESFNPSYPVFHTCFFRIFPWCRIQSLGVPIEQSWMKTTFPFPGGPRAATCNPSRNLVAPSLLPAANAGCSPPSVASRVSGCLTLAVCELWCHWHIFMGLQKLYRCKCIISRIDYQSDFNFQASWRKIRTRNIIFHQMIAKKISLKDLNS